MQVCLLSISGTDSAVVDRESDTKIAQLIMMQSFDATFGDLHVHEPSWGAFSKLLSYWLILIRICAVALTTA